MAHGPIERTATSEWTSMTSADEPSIAASTGRTRTPRHRAVAVATPGLEAGVATELDALGLRSARVTTGGVRFTATTRQLYAANLWLRSATRVVVRVARFEARSFAELESEVGAVDWAAWLAPGRPVRLRVSSSTSRLHHTGAIAERVHRASGHPPPPRADDDPDRSSRDDDTPLVVVRVVRDQVTISVDSSGAPLWRRGWRLETAKAPLRETLAAALLLAAPWDPATPLIDPMCGSGTIAIEAALLARGRAPGRDRSFAFADWPTFEPGTWASVLEEARRAEAAVAVGPVRIAASDRDAGAVRAARANAERAGVADALVIDRHAISDLMPASDGPGLLLTNPPYAKRVGGGDRRDLFARLGSVARDRLAGGQMGLLVDDAGPVRSSGIRFQERMRTTNGGIPVRLLVGPI
jgi:putative N6-adenine-specific DNA methylase